MSAVSSFTNDSVRKSIPTGTNSRCLRKRFEDWPSPSRHPESRTGGVEGPGRDSLKVILEHPSTRLRDDRRIIARPLIRVLPPAPSSLLVHRATSHNCEL